MKILPEEVSYDSSTLNNLLHGREDSSLYREAQIIVPHLSLHNLIEKLPSSDEEVYYLNDIKSYLQPSEYMTPNLKEHHQENHTS